METESKSKQSYVQRVVAMLFNCAQYYATA